MIYGMYLSTAGGLVESAKADVIAHNLANASTPGFKKELMTFTRRQSPRDVQGAGLNGNPILDAVGGGVLIQETYTDLSNAGSRKTDNPLDLYIHGDGFFAVTDGRQTYYTRAGNFTLDPEGFLTTADGAYRVLNEGGSTIEAAGERFSVGVDGTISITRNGVEEEVGRIGTFDFVERGEGFARLAQVMDRHGDNLFRYTGAEAKPVVARIEQGSQEVSGVESTQELVAMIGANRAYEANLNMIQAQDSTLQRLIGQVGRIPGQ